jgi:hypothetical protein
MYLLKSVQYTQLHIQVLLTLMIKNLAESQFQTQTFQVDKTPEPREIEIKINNCEHIRYVKQLEQHSTAEVHESWQLAENKRNFYISSFYILYQ